VLVAQIEFLERTDADRLRHSTFVGLREDRNPRSVVGTRSRVLTCAFFAFRRRENLIPFNSFGFKLGKPSPGIFHRFMFRTVG
jgi:hypothetical protein